jgi:hypothetical protein
LGVLGAGATADQVLFDPLFCPMLMKLLLSRIPVMPSKERGPKRQSRVRRTVGILGRKKDTIEDWEYICMNDWSKVVAEYLKDRGELVVGKI